LLLRFLPCRRIGYQNWLAVTKNMTWTKLTKPLTAAFAMLAIVASMIALVPSARAADPTCDQFKSRLVEAAQALEQAGLSPPVIRYEQQKDMGPLKVFEVPIAEGDVSDLYCRDDRFDSFDVIFMPTNDVRATLRFRYLMTAPSWRSQNGRQAPR